MSYQIIPNILFFIAILGAIIVILRHLPEAASKQGQGDAGANKPEQKLQEKGLPAITASKVKSTVFFWGRRSWHFMLEAKGIKHPAAAAYRIKQIFKKKSVAEQIPAQHARALDIPAPTAKDEAHYLQAIKQNPRDLSNYAGLAQIYIEAKSFEEAKDVYEYLVKHDSANAEFRAKLGYVYYKLGSFKDAIASYERSLSLDSSHPSRYYNLGLAHKSAENPIKAAEFFKKALSLDPQNEKYKEALKEVKV